jgi:hypothetical protein
MIIKCVTLYQPWASLIMIGAKPYEFRSWSYVARGVGVRPGDVIGIHAGVRPTRPAEVRDLLERLDDPDNSTGLVAALARPLLERLAAAHKCRGIIEHSALLGTAVIGKPVLACDLKPEWAALLNDSDRLEHSNWAWPMTDVRRFDVTIMVPGHQGFWNCPVSQEGMAISTRAAPDAPSAPASALERPA